MNSRDRTWLWIGRLARWSLAALFLYAGISKLTEPTLLARQIRNYHLSPWWMVHPLAIVLPWVEILPALLLVPGRWILASTAVLSTLAILFITAVGWALHQDLNIQCGCFGGDSMVSWGHIAGNLGLLLLATLAIACHRSGPKSPHTPVPETPSSSQSCVP